MAGSFASRLAETEEARAAAQETSEDLAARAGESIRRLSRQLGALKEKVPTEADRLVAEAKAGADLEAKWRVKVERAAEELEASKVSVQGLLMENLRLRVALQGLAGEAERSMAEATANFQKKV